MPLNPPQNMRIPSNGKRLGCSPHALELALHLLPRQATATGTHFLVRLPRLSLAQQTVPVELVHEPDGSMDFVPFRCTGLAQLEVPGQQRRVFLEREGECQ